MSRRKKILLVDDEAGMRQIMKQILKELGDFEFYEAANGVSAVTEALRAKPDIIFLDVLMPVLDGVETLKQIKEEDDIKNIPVIMVTSESSLKVVREVIKQGAADYIVKPFELKTLQEKAQKWL